MRRGKARPFEGRTRGREKGDLKDPHMQEAGAARPNEATARGAGAKGTVSQNGAFKAFAFTNVTHARQASCTHGSKIGVPRRAFCVNYELLKRGETKIRGKKQEALQGQLARQESHVTAFLSIKFHLGV